MPIITDDDIGHTIFGSPGSDTINALGGDDTIIPQLGADIVNGGAGLLDLLAVDYSTTLTPVTMSAPAFTGAVYSGFDAPGGQGVVALGGMFNPGGSQVTFSSSEP